MRHLVDCLIYSTNAGLIIEQYDQAIKDLTECLAIQTVILPPEDRCIAETLYQLGLACTFHLAYDDAVVNYRQAIKVIESKIKQLTVVVASDAQPDSGSFDTPAELAQREIRELEDILPDIHAKVNGGDGCIGS